MSRHRASYYQYLTSRTWARQRERALRRARQHCQVCAAQAALEVHHSRYPRRWGAERKDELVVLCRTCHRMYHSKERI